MEQLVVAVAADDAFLSRMGLPQALEFGVIFAFKAAKRRKSLTVGGASAESMSETHGTEYLRLQNRVSGGRNEKWVKRSEPTDCNVLWSLFIYESDTIIIQTVLSFFDVQRQ